MEVPNKMHALLESSEDSEFSMKRIFAKVQIEHCTVLYFSAFPVGIGHGNLIKIR